MNITLNFLILILTTTIRFFKIIINPTIHISPGVYDHSSSGYLHSILLNQYIGNLTLGCNNNNKKFSQKLATLDPTTLEFERVAKDIRPERPRFCVKLNYLKR